MDKREELSQELKLLRDCLNELWDILPQVGKYFPVIEGATEKIESLVDEIVGETSSAKFFRIACKDYENREMKRWFPQKEKRVKKEKAKLLKECRENLRRREKKNEVSR